MSQFRVYFYNLETRTEMTDYEGNGKTWLSTGGMVRNKNGKFVQGTTDRVGFCSYGSLSKVIGNKEVTAADFDHPVAVKVWFGPSNIEWRKLVAEDAFSRSIVEAVASKKYAGRAA
jgi:hypothetical protein